MRLKLFLKAELVNIGLIEMISGFDFWLAENNWFSILIVKISL